MKYILIAIMFFLYSCSQPTEAEKLIEFVIASDKVDLQTDVSIVDTIKIEKINDILSGVDSVIVKLDSQILRLPVMIEDLNESLEENEKMSNENIHKMLKPFVEQTILELNNSITATEKKLSITKDRLKELKVQKGFFQKSMKNTKDGDVFYVVKGIKDGEEIVLYLNTEKVFVDYQKNINIIFNTAFSSNVDS
jgi:uncharacterized coiled-coil protein SlyX